MKVGRVDYRCASIMKLEERKVKDQTNFMSIVAPRT